MKTKWKLYRTNRVFKKTNNSSFIFPQGILLAQEIDDTDTHVVVFVIGAEHIARIAVNTPLFIWFHLAYMESDNQWNVV